MSAKILDIDKFTGITETFKQDAMTGKIEVKKFQDTSKIISSNQGELNSSSTSWKGEFHKVASIPMIFLDIWREELKKMGATNCNPLARENKTFFIAKVNSGEFSKFRTKAGKI